MAAGITNKSRTRKPQNLALMKSTSTATLSPTLKSLRVLKPMPLGRLLGRSLYRRRLRQRPPPRRGPSARPETNQMVSQLPKGPLAMSRLFVTLRASCRPSTLPLRMSPMRAHRFLMVHCPLAKENLPCRQRHPNRTNTDADRSAALPPRTAP